MSPLGAPRPQVPVGGVCGPRCPPRPLQRGVRASVSVVPQAARRKGCLKLWRACTAPGGVLACPAASLLNQLKKAFLHRVRGKYPGQLEIGSSLHLPGVPVPRPRALVSAQRPQRDCKSPPVLGG